MLKLGLVFLSLSVLACADMAATPLKGNYDVMQNFTITFMTAYEGKLFNASQTCFSNAATSKLDSDVVAIMKSLAFGHMDALDMYAKTLVSDLQLDFQVCRVTDLSISFHNNLKVHGYAYFVGNAFWRALDIYACAGRAALDLLGRNYYGLGLELGTMAKYLNPPLLMVSNTEMLTASRNFVSGLLVGLELTPGSSDTCYSDLSALNTNEQQFVTDLWSLLSGNVAAAFSLMADVNSFLTAINDSAPACNLSGLGQFFLGLLTSQGITQTMTNLSDNIVAINQASTAFHTCMDDFYQCGYSTGEVFRLISGWGI